MVMGVLDKDYFYLNTYCIDCSYKKYLHALTLHVFLDPSFHIETSIPMNSLDMSLHFPPPYCQ